MIEFTVGQDFLVAVQRRYQEREPIEWKGLTGIIVEAISHQDYLEVWAFRGFPSDAISAVRPRFYYRCVRTADERTSHFNSQPISIQTQGGAI
jgi:hypothetical protein